MDLRRIKAIALGHAIGDALGVPVEFCARESRKEDPVTGMRGYGTHFMPAGTWSDDTSMALATLDSLVDGVSYLDMMRKFCAWFEQEEYTATGEVFDFGGATANAIRRYQRGILPLNCGGAGEFDNGNGSLMRTYPAVLYWYYRKRNSKEALNELVFSCSSLTHAHVYSKLACGIYAYVLIALLAWPEKESVWLGLQDAKAQFEQYSNELSKFERLFSEDFASLPESEISSSGFVIATLEAAIWCLLNSDSYAECVLKAVNLGRDTDTVAAVAGSLAGAMYGLEGIPEEWLNALLRREYIEELCEKFAVEESSVVVELPKGSLPEVVDVHSHTVFGVDDGAVDLKMSQDMIRAAEKQGVRAVFCASHSRCNEKAYGKNLCTLQKWVQQEKIPVKLYSACEIACSKPVLQDVICGINDGSLCGFNGSEWILLEFAPRMSAEELLECVQIVLQQTGKKVVIAHVERYQAVRRNPNLLDDLLNLGCRFQVNAYSLEKESDPEIKEFARELLHEKRVSFLGSDAHRMDHRPPDVLAGVTYILDNCEPEYAEEVLSKNAKQYFEIEES